MSEGTPQARRWLLSGRVQGVGFRHYTLGQARRLGVVGWVRNLPDGRVEIRVAGDPQEVATFRERIEQGPRWGRVDRLEEEAIEADPGWTRFEVRF